MKVRMKGLRTGIIREGLEGAEDAQEAKKTAKEAEVDRMKRADQTQDPIEKQISITIL